MAIKRVFLSPFFLISILLFFNYVFLLGIVTVYCLIPCSVILDDLFTRTQYDVGYEIGALERDDRTSERFSRGHTATLDAHGAGVTSASQGVSGGQRCFQTNQSLMCLMPTAVNVSIGDVMSVLLDVVYGR